MATPYYVQFPEYKNRPAWDPSPVQNALIESRKAFKELSDADYQDRRMGLAERADAREQQAFDQKQIAGLAQMVDADNSPQRPEAWRKVVDSVPGFRDALVQAGQDPYDHVNGPKFVIAKARGYVDPLDEQQKKQTIATGAANEQYARSHAKYMEERSDTGKYNAETRRMKALTDFQQKFGNGEGVTPEIWNQDLQNPNGYIRAAFGRLVPYDQMPTAIQQVKDRSQMTASDDDLARQGINPKAMKDLQMSELIRSRVGKDPKVGYMWAIDERNGNIYQKRMTEADEKGALPEAQLEQQMANVRKAFPIIAGTYNKATGQLSGGASLVGKAIANTPYVGGYLNPSTAEAFMTTQHAALQMSYALSGKQIGQQEQGRILEYFSPKAGDSAQIAAFKMDAMHQIYTRLLDARRRNVSDADRAKLFDSALDKAEDRVKRMQAGSGNYQPEAGALSTLGPPDEKKSDGWSIRRID